MRVGPKLLGDRKCRFVGRIRFLVFTGWTSKRNRPSWTCSAAARCSAIMARNRPATFDALERAAREFYGVEHALAVNSGTGALMTAMTALAMGPGCEVILPSFFWVATVGAVVQANAIPVLCEVDDSFTMDPQDLERKISPHTRLIVSVHMAGAPCNMEAVMAVANRHGIPVLEDCAKPMAASFAAASWGRSARSACSACR